MKTHLIRLVVLVLAVCVSSAAAWADDPPKPAPKPAPAKPAPKPQPKPAPAQPAPQPEDVPKKKAPLTFHNEGMIEKDDGTVAYFYRTNFVKPADLLNSLKLLGFNGFDQIKLKPFDKQNQLVIEGDSDLVEIVLDAIAYFDVATPQVYIEAKVIEITYQSNFEIGFDELFDRSANGPNTLFRGSSSVLNPSSALRSGFTPNFPFQGTSLFWGFVGQNAMKYGDLDVTLQALQQDGKAEVLSRPSLIATQGIQATFKTEENIPLTRMTTANASGPQFTLTNTTAGVTMTVNPKHIGESFVTLEVAPEVRGIQGLSLNQVAASTFTPITTVRNIKTTVTLGDNETLVIGGLYTNSSVNEKASTPLLSDLPLIGDFFSRKRETKQKRELVFIITPHIVRKTHELRIIVPPSELERLEGGAVPEKPACKPFHEHQLLDALHPKHPFDADNK